MRDALVLGKFLPPHLGHLHLIGFAERFADQARVVVEAMPGESIPVERRASWLEELCPRSEILILRDHNPQLPEQHERFWEIWRASLLRLLGRAPSFVIASEAYGARLAQELGARFIPLDPAREALDISATRVRRAPLAHWDYLPPPVRAHYALRVRVVGAESSGKSSLAAQLAAHYKTRLVPEFAERVLSVAGTGASPDSSSLPPSLIADFGLGQIAAEDSLARFSNRVLICDTCALTSATWCELLHGSAPPELAELAAARHYSLSLVCDPDVAFVAAPHRVSESSRRPFAALLERSLATTPEPKVRISGSWEQRFERAVKAIDSALAPLTEASDVADDVPPASALGSS